MTAYATLLAGDPAPWFRQRCTTALGSYTFDMAAGRHIVLFFFGSGRDDEVGDALALVRAASPDPFDGVQASFFGVSADPADEAERRLAETPPAMRFFWDSDKLVGRLYGAQPLPDDPRAPHRPRWVLLDPMLRVQGVWDAYCGTVGAVIAALRQRIAAWRADTHRMAPVLALDAVFEPAFCERLVTHYETVGGISSGVLTEAEVGVSATVADRGFKRRHDCVLRDGTLVEQVQARIIRRVVPEIRKAFQFEATRLERLIVACYDSEDRGCFGAHRDNTVRATAHRRFAVSINLNDDFDGGELLFPEFGSRRYRPGVGGALVFSCSLMHAVAPVVRGRRYACLPFVFDANAGSIKQANRAVS
ncbi:2OG-Fe(II) oxygenase [Lichenicoccus sp.]|uniref:2OG-Fe(II) oxygenase family protein n=1 Tax=Lichenicoccus sp. TaxID=2781899 RepID=UPI003D0D4254